MLESLHTDTSRWEIGPYHGALPGPMRLRLKLDGEIIVSGEVDTGFLHRGLEKALELHSWQAAMAYADHLDPEAAVFGEIVLAEAAEQIAEIEIPDRAKAIRVLLCELSRISSHLLFIVRMAKAVGAETMMHYALRDRERVLDLFELLTGARFSINFLRFGGVKADITDGFLERVLEVCDLTQVRLKEYNDLFTFNHAFLKRTQDVGVVSAAQVRTWGVSGPIARAAGAMKDVRKSDPYCGYERLDFEVPLESGGGAHARFLVRLREIAASVSLLRQTVEAVPGGEFAIGRIEKDFSLPEGEGLSRVESARGALLCHLVSDGSANPARVQFKTPTTSHLMLVPELIQGLRLEDLPMLLASLDLSLAEADR